MDLYKRAKKYPGCEPLWSFSGVNWAYNANMKTMQLQSIYVQDTPFVQRLRMDVFGTMDMLDETYFAQVQAEIRGRATVGKAISAENAPILAGAGAASSAAAAGGAGAGDDDDEGEEVPGATVTCRPRRTPEVYAGEAKRKAIAAKRKRDADRAAKGADCDSSPAEWEGMGDSDSD